MEHDVYTDLFRLLNRHGARYRLIAHQAEGRTEVVSALRGNELKDAAKSMILMVKVGKKKTKYVLAIVPGDRRVDLAAVKTLYAATYVAFASKEVAERLAGSSIGTILPFAFNDGLEAIADPALRQSSELYFNAARLDRSIVLNTEDYFAIANPRNERIADGQR